MKKRLIHVAPLQLGITLGILYAILAIIILIPVFLLISLAGVVGAAQTGTALPAVFSGVFLIFLPVIYGVLGFIVGVIMAFIYNLVAKWTGGVEFTTQEVQ